MCINCTLYNFRILASASDDRNIILWDPFRYEKKLVLRTGHYGNIFSVKVFLYVNFLMLGGVNTISWSIVREVFNFLILRMILVYAKVQ